MKQRCNLENYPTIKKVKQPGIIYICCERYFRHVKLPASNEMTHSELSRFTRMHLRVNYGKKFHHTRRFRRSALISRQRYIIRFLLSFFIRLFIEFSDREYFELKFKSFILLCKRPTKKTSFSNPFTSWQTSYYEFFFATLSRKIELWSTANHRGFKFTVSRSNTQMMTQFPGHPGRKFHVSPRVSEIAECAADLKKER